MRIAIVLAALAFSLMLLPALYLASCTNTLDGEVYENQKPIVYFSNIPPVGQRFSRNPVVYWYGTDPDGLIDYYRYYIVTDSVVGLMAPEDYILTLDSMDWNYIGLPEIDTTWWGCRTWQHSVCLDSVEVFQVYTETVFDTTYWICNEYSGADCIDSTSTTSSGNWDFIHVDTIVPEDSWDFMHIDTTYPDPFDPHTENIIPLEANQNDPVNTYVPQWIFLQAFDMEGLGSDIVFRLFFRNDHPPETNIGSFSGDLPFVNSPTPGGIVTGVKLRWSGSDIVDYPGEAPPFEFHWRLYGPYADSAFRQLVDSFVRPVFVTIDGRVYNEGDTVIHCDTLFGDSVTVMCDTVVVSEGVERTWGQAETKFLVDDPNFIADPYFNKVADSSFSGIDPWVLNTTDTIYDVYKYDQSDTTQEKWFMFWIRSRDDAFVADLVPAFDSFTVIDPRYERDIGVLDFTAFVKPGENTPTCSCREYWKGVIEHWDPNVEFDTIPLGTSGWQKSYAPDYLGVKKVGDNLGDVPMAFMLKHKVLILYDDDIKSSIFPDREDNIYKAIDAGVNVWATWRAPVIGDGMVSEHWAVFPGQDYMRYFGVSQLAFSAWFCHAAPWEGGVLHTACSTYAGRIEDFIGAYAIDSVGWPNLDIDTALLHSRYFWGPYPSLRFLPEHPGLPEVDWSVRTPATEVLYLYKSFYGSNHPYGGSYNMEGNPVGHRLATSLFRTVHFNFTPLAIKPTQMQVVASKVLDWLYPTDLSSPTSGIRYPDAAQSLSVSDARKHYWQRCAERELSKDKLPDWGKYLR